MGELELNSASYPYKDYWLCSIVFKNKQTGRKTARLIDKITNKIRQIPYARYLYETTQKVKLNKDQIIHHINHDCSDDRMENFEVVLRKDHPKLHPRKSQFQEQKVTCQQCVKIFNMSVRQVQNRYYKRLYGAIIDGPFCSKNCQVTFMHHKNRDATMCAQYNLVCPSCGNLFDMTLKQWTDFKRRDKIKEPFCSIKCANRCKRKIND